MYQYTTTRVINGSADSSGKDIITAYKNDGSLVTGVAVDADLIDVLRSGKFLKDRVEAMYLRDYSEGIIDSAEITPEYDSVIEGSVIKLTITTSSSSKQDRPTIIETISSGDVATDLVALAASYEGVLTLTVAGTTLTLEAPNSYTYIEEVSLDEEVVTGYPNMGPDYDLIAEADITTGSDTFGDTRWMESSVRIPTVANTRPTGLSDDEKIIQSAEYSQFTLCYFVNHDNEVGIHINDKSVTKHVFYVVSDQVAAWEQAFKTNLGLDAAGKWHEITA